jgi:hypothetical protein
MLMTLHNDIWGDTSVTLIEEIDSQFLIVRELNMLALYSRLDKEQSKALQKALTTFYEILFSSKDKANINDTVPFTPDVSFDDDGNEYLCLVSPMQENSIANLRAIAQKISEVDAKITALPASRKAVVSYEVAQLIIHGGKDEV